MTETQMTGPLGRVVADLHLLISNLKKNDKADIRQELVFNTYPAMIALAEQIGEIDDAIQELVDQQESYLQPALAGLIETALAIGRELATEISKLAISDDLAKKRIADLVKAYSQSAEMASLAVREAIIDDDEDDNDDTDNGPGDEEDETPTVPDGPPVKPEDDGEDEDNG